MTDTALPTQAAPARVTPAQFTAALDNVLKYWPLGTATCFAFGVWPLAIIFGEWGLPFMQLVDAKDILFLTMAFALIALSVLNVIYMLGLLADVAFTKLTVEQRTWLSLVILAACDLAWAPGVITEPLWRLLVGALALGICGQFFFNLKKYRTRPIWSVVALIFLTAAPVTFWLHFSGAVTRDYFAKSGFVGGYWVAQGNGVPCDGRVLWLGAKTVVLRCDGVGEGRVGVRVLTKTEGLVLSGERPAASAGAASLKAAITAPGSTSRAS